MTLLRLLVVVSAVVALLLAGCIAPQEADGPAASGPAVVPANVTREHFEGRMLCGIGTAIGTSNPCLTLGGSKNVFAFSANRSLETLIVGMRWTPTTMAGEQLQLLLESRGFHVLEPEDEVRYASASGEPDLVVRVDASDLRGTDWSWDDGQGPLDFQVRVFPARTATPSIVAAQAFDVHVVAFHGAPAPDGFDPFPDQVARAPS